MSDMRKRLIYMLMCMLPFNTAGIEAAAEYLLSCGVIVPPCRVGDTVYYRTYENNGSEDIGLQPHEVIGIKTIVQTKGADIPIEAFGKDVFLSKKEAERME